MTVLKLRWEPSQVTTMEHANLYAGGVRVLLLTVNKTSEGAVWNLDGLSGGRGGLCSTLALAKESAEQTAANVLAAALSQLVGSPATKEGSAV